MKGTSQYNGFRKLEADIKMPDLEEHKKDYVYKTKFSHIKAGSLPNF